MSITTSLPQLYSFGHELEMDDDKVGLLRNSADAKEDIEELHRRFDEDGYLYIKGGLDKDEVMAARASLTDGLAAAGVLDENFPRIDGVCKPGSGYVFKPELTNNNPAIQKLLYSGNLHEFYRKYYGEEVRHYDFTWLRAIGPGKGTNPHCDLPYMGRGTHKHMTCWVPYGDISFTLGGLMVLEGSHKRMDLLENYVYRDVDAFCENKPKEVEAAKTGKWTFSGTLSHNPPAIRNKFGKRWLTTEFEAGDFITFGMFLVHASLDNRSENRLRISSDCRYQRASEPIDERWVGINPPGHTTAGKQGRIC
ncbi:phytanoyl-CoA dioxygenase family protein [Oleiharenicola lentus]|uniref:phytanoyl-CoA dioxygenase family protein n=1 Tax=Oleiharenicola lentus TaxID=2508720 RepID=UPI003F664AA1